MDFYTSAPRHNWWCARRARCTWRLRRNAWAYLCRFAAQTVMLGSGMDEYESAMRGLEAAHPAHFRGWVGFSIPVAHRIVAGDPQLLLLCGCGSRQHSLANC